ncbi:MAG: hypothetical protein IPP68_04445 [Elusimicrobia bacterium]|nr:hypothetical protein [Elusimicrobiota bacterium]
MLGRTVTTKERRWIGWSKAGSVFVQGAKGGLGFVKWTPLAEAAAVMTAGKLPKTLTYRAERGAANYAAKVEKVAVDAKRGLTFAEKARITATQQGAATLSLTEGMLMGMGADHTTAWAVEKGAKAVGLNSMTAESLGRSAGSFVGGVSMGMVSRYRGRDMELAQDFVKGKFEAGKTYSVNIQSAEALALFKKAAGKYEKVWIKNRVEFKPNVDPELLAAMKPADVAKYGKWLNTSEAANVKAEFAAREKVLLNDRIELDLLVGSKKAISARYERAADAVGKVKAQQENVLAVKKLELAKLKQDLIQIEQTRGGEAGGILQTTVRQKGGWFASFGEKINRFFGRVPSADPGRNAEIPKGIAKRNLSEQEGDSAFRRGFSISERIRRVFAGLVGKERKELSGIEGNDWRISKDTWERKGYSRFTRSTERNRSNAAGDQDRIGFREKIDAPNAFGNKGTRKPNKGTNRDFEQTKELTIPDFKELKVEALKAEISELRVFQSSLDSAAQVFKEKARGFKARSEDFRRASVDVEKKRVALRENRLALDSSATKRPSSKKSAVEMTVRAIPDRPVYEPTGLLARAGVLWDKATLRKTGNYELLPATADSPATLFVVAAEKTPLSTFSRLGKALQSEYVVAIRLSNKVGAKPEITLFDVATHAEGRPIMSLRQVAMGGKEVSAGGVQFNDYRDAIRLLSSHAAINGKPIMSRTAFFEKIRDVAPSLSAEVQGYIADEISSAATKGLKSSVRQWLLGDDDHRNKGFLLKTFGKNESVVGNERGGILAENVSFKQAFRNLKESFFPNQAKSLPAAPADGPPLLPSGEKTPVSAPPGKSVGAGAAHEFHRFADYSQTALINRGKHGADSVFNQSFESRVSPDFTNGGQKLVRYMAENKIDTINGRQLTPHELNTLATEVSNKIMTSGERANSFVKDGNGNKLIEVWANDFDGGIFSQKRESSSNSSDRIPTGKDDANFQPAARAGPPHAATQTQILQQRQDALLNGASGVNITPRSSAVKYETIGSGHRTFLTDLKAVEGVVGPLTGDRIKITKSQARLLEKEIGLNRNYLEPRNIIYIVDDINARAPASPIKGNNYFQGGNKGLPGGGPEITIHGIPSVGGRNVRQIILEVD